MNIQMNISKKYALASDTTKNIQNWGTQKKTKQMSWKEKKFFKQEISKRKKS